MVRLVHQVDTARRSRTTGVMRNGLRISASEGWDRTVSGVEDQVLGGGGMGAGPSGVLWTKETGSAGAVDN
ncbi:hypothetical protein GCM10010412_026440 [Nonomuraea recticatena]|uniref:Uncharacterized protein n=1 Tax=Nonomuraea recticatena TaxID=46178 RepID=A0ABP6DZF0_9ACTN